MGTSGKETEEKGTKRKMQPGNVVPLQHQSQKPKNKHLELLMSTRNKRVNCLTSKKIIIKRCEFIKFYL